MLSIKGIGLSGSPAAAEQADATKRMGIIYYREALRVRACALRLVQRSLRFGEFANSRPANQPVIPPLARDANLRRFLYESLLSSRRSRENKIARTVQQ